MVVSSKSAGQASSIDAILARLNQITQSLTTVQDEPPAKPTKSAKRLLKNHLGSSQAPPDRLPHTPKLAPNGTYWTCRFSMSQCRLVVATLERSYASHLQRELFPTVYFRWDIENPAQQNIVHDQLRAANHQLTKIAKYLKTSGYTLSPEEWQHLLHRMFRGKLGSAEQPAVTRGLIIAHLPTIAECLIDEILGPANLPPDHTLITKHRKPKMRHPAKHQTANMAADAEANGDAAYHRRGLDPNRPVVSVPHYDMPAPINHVPCAAVGLDQISEDERRLWYGLPTLGVWTTLADTVVSTTQESVAAGASVFNLRY